ncbi:DUF1493 family protein, partial [Pseudoalteromonas luteoviolacea]
MAIIEDIYQLIESECGMNPNKLSPNSDIVDEFCVYGDDFEELMVAYSKQINVNLDTYLWYFHSREEADSPFAFIFPPPDQTVKRIVITPELLLKYANSKAWSINYPEHTLPKRRWDCNSPKK